jgi:hypothetical protein
VNRHDLVQRALQLLAKPIKTEESVPCPHVLDPPPPIQPSWRVLAELTAGLEQDDPRLSLVLETMTQGGKAQDAGDIPGFERAVARVHYLMQFTPGALVHWRGSEGHRLAVLGPAMVEHVHCHEGQLWVYTEWRGIGRSVSESIIGKIGIIDAPVGSTLSTPPHGGAS